MSDRVRVWDFVLIGVLLVACCLALIPRREAGQQVEIRVDGQVCAVLSLTEDSEYILPDETTVSVHAGRVRIVGSHCPDHLCEKEGAISRAGECLLCLPNRISVRILGGEVDGIVG